jgi:hypothetical protein
MTERDEDPKLSQRYRDLPREEPSEGIDAAILAAARRAVGARPAPLVVPAGRRRWYFPLAAAAVILLSATVVFRIWYEAPGIDGGAPAPAAPAPEREKAAVPTPAVRDGTKVGERPDASRLGAASRVEPAKTAPARAFAPEPKKQEVPAPRPVPQSAVADAVGSAPSSAEVAARAPAAPAEPKPAPMLERRAMGKLAQEAGRDRAIEDSPERWLERIAELRRQQRDDEADRQLAEFRKRYPDYKIPDSALRR